LIRAKVAVRVLVFKKCGAKYSLRYGRRVVFHLYFFSFGKTAISVYF
jgi:hypothetical protein